MVGRLACVSIAMAGFIGGAAFADDDRAAFAACAAVADDLERLRCYDRAARPSAGTREPDRDGVSHDEQWSSDREESQARGTPPLPVNDVDRFGLAGKESEGGEVDEIEARIVAIDLLQNGERVFRLENGQVWRETAPTPRLRVGVGETVSVRSGLFGSYKLFGSGNVSTRVERIE